ncbi:MAG: aromatic amino acid lyase [bacterium]|nr:aromatic amino acid lyase [bacterium]
MNVIEPEIRNNIIISDEFVSLSEIIDVAKNNSIVTISSHSRFVEKMELSRELLLKALSDGVPVYGVTTGFGKSCGKRLDMEKTRINGQNLIRFHGCGTGDPIGIEETRAAMFCRLISLAKGYSGVSMGLLEQIAAFLNKNIIPVVPSEGSVGASGDLTPMSYIAAALSGDREVFYRGERVPAAAALEKEGLSPHVFEPKEPLAIMNGTTTMTGIAAIVSSRAHSILQGVIYATTLSVHALKGNLHHFHPTISKAKPYRGQAFVSNQLNELLQTTTIPAELEAEELETLQDPYSIRCTPQVMGVLSDALEWVDSWIATEANSANDNPLIEPDSGEILMGGNFYGGHMAFAMDALKAALASAADLSDRQIALMVNPNVNRGLPADLVSASDEEQQMHHGFKAMSISSSALAAEALKGTMPAASFSRSTESNNQDKVSMGTIAARDARRIIDLTERVLAIHLLAAAQGCEIRGNLEYRPKVAELVKKIRKIADPVSEDRPMDNDIEQIVQTIAEYGLNI